MMHFSLTTWMLCFFGYMSLAVVAATVYLVFFNTSNAIASRDGDNKWYDNTDGEDRFLICVVGLFWPASLTCFLFIALIKGFVRMPVKLTIFIKTRYHSK